MRVGGSIALGVLGAILYFAVTVDVAGISLSAVGVILMIGAAVWFLVELARGFTDNGDAARSTSTSTSQSGSTQQDRSSRQQ